jgi:hypothetical protein
MFPLMQAWLQVECRLCHVKSDLVNLPELEALMHFIAAGWKVETQPAALVCPDCQKKVRH